MTDYEKKLIADAFGRCYGLKHIMQTSIRSRAYAIQALSEQTGLRKEFIEKNYEDIVLM